MLVTPYTVSGLKVPVTKYTSSSIQLALNLIRMNSICSASPPSAMSVSEGSTAIGPSMGHHGA